MGPVIDVIVVLLATAGAVFIAMRIVRARSRGDHDAPRAPTPAPIPAPEPTAAAEEKAPPRKTAPDLGNVIDLRELESTRMRVKGTAYYIPDSQRRYAGSRVYHLVREPHNPHDDMAIAVIADDGRKVGHVSANRAALMAPYSTSSTPTHI